MTRILMATAAVFTLAAPAFAQSAAQKAVNQFNESLSGNEEIELNPGIGITPEAAEIHAQNAANSNMGNPANDPTAAELLDGNSVANGQALIILEDLDEEEGAGAVN